LSKLTTNLFDLRFVGREKQHLHKRRLTETIRRRDRVRKTTYPLKIDPGIPRVAV
jgi:hypothetical protein